MDGGYHLSLSPNRKVTSPKQNKTRSLPLSLSGFLSAEGPCEQAPKYEVGSSRLGDPKFPGSRIRK